MHDGESVPSSLSVVGRCIRPTVRPEEEAASEAEEACDLVDRACPSRALAAAELYFYSFFSVAVESLQSSIQ